MSLPRPLAWDSEPLSSFQRGPNVLGRSASRDTLAYLVFLGALLLAGS